MKYFITICYKIYTMSSDKIYNPKTGRMVSKTGVIGKQLLKSQNSDDNMMDTSEDININEKLPGDYQNQVSIIPISKISPKLYSTLDVDDVDISRNHHLSTEIINQFGLDDDDTFVKYEIYVFGTELDKKSSAYNCKLSHKGINHAALKLLGSNGQYYTIEWGNITSDWETEFDPISQSDSYWYEHSSINKGKKSTSIWKGCRVLHGNINISAQEVADHAIKWNLELGNRGKSTYPFNCRGYVDSFLVTVLKTGIIDWVNEGLF